VASRKKKQVSKPRSEQTHPTVSFRMSRPRLGHLDDIVARLNTSRSELFNAVLDHHIDERGDEAIVAILERKKEADANQLDIFA